MNLVKTADENKFSSELCIWSLSIHWFFFFTEIQTKSLQNKYQAALKDIEHQKELLNTARKDTEEISKLSENFEKQFVAEREAHLKYKREVETKLVLFFK